MKCITLDVYRISEWRTCNHIDDSIVQGNMTVQFTWALGEQRNFGNAISYWWTKSTLTYAMVTYSLRRVCGGRTATLSPQTVRRPSGFYANCTATSRFLARRSVIASLAFFFNLTLNFFSETAMPQRRNHTAMSSYGGRTVALRWPWGDIRFLPCLGCLENRTAASRRPYGGRAANL